MHLDMVQTRFVSHAGAKQTLDSSHIPEIRKLLRTDMSIAEIAAFFDVSLPTVRNFIKRRAICNMRDRNNFITLQRSIAREEIETDDQ